MALMGAAEQTRLSWAKPVNAVEDIPTSYLDYLDANLPDVSACLPAVLTPTFRGFLRRENEKLVFIHAEHLYILEQTTSELLPTVFPIIEINSIEAGAILLKAWLRVSGLIDGQLTSITLKYNTVTQFLFDPLVAYLRCTLSEAERSREAFALSEAERSREGFALSEAERSREGFTLSEAERSREGFALSEAEENGIFQLLRAHQIYIYLFVSNRIIVYKGEIKLYKKVDRLWILFLIHFHPVQDLLPLN